ncbi:RNA-directed DNA polymerase, eukaryota, partial [Tanacetum coccineum]
MSKCSNWNAIIQKFSSKLFYWKAGLLSVGGRLSLIKSVLVIRMKKDDMCEMEEMFNEQESWRSWRYPKGGAESSQFDSLQAAIENVALSDQCDSWQWSLDVSVGRRGTLLWSIWSFRNRLIFSSLLPKKAMLWDSIVSQLFLWISSRNPKPKFSWVVILSTAIFPSKLIKGWIGFSIQRSNMISRSKEDQVMRISKSVFVTNFTDTFGYRDLWKLCESYGKVIDVFIPNRLSKAGKRFAFVRFIRVTNMDQLIGNLCTLWAGRFHLHANAVRYERPSRPANPVRNPPPKPSKISGSYANVVKDVKSPISTSVPSFDIPTVVLDDSCIISRDLSHHVMGKVKDPNSIPNLQITLFKEGFPEVSLSYLGGLWVLLELDSVVTKSKLLQHTGVNSWFDKLQDAVHDFVSEERIVWVDIEGIPLNLWSRETFVKLGKKWGETLDIEENSCSSFARKRLCVKTKQVDNILESFKFIFKGKIYMARAKELFAWTPLFKGCKHSVYSSDDESSLGANSNHASQHLSDDEQVIESDEERVSESSFGVNPSPQNISLCKNDSKVDDHHSGDPFGLYDLLKKPHKEVVEDLDPSLSHPPGFTPEFPQQEFNHNNVPKKENTTDRVLENVFSSKVHSKVFNFSQEILDKDHSSGSASSNFSHNESNGGSILGAMEDMIRIGQSMGYDMEGCSKDMERIIASDSVGNSGGILCVWEASIFNKDNVTISDNFIALYGTWLPTNSKVLIVVIYAPQSNVLKRSLWDYISVLISRWKGETLMMGDFNEVRSADERFGSLFDQSGARDFNQFISSSGLVEVKMEGYSFTWSLSSAAKMSKLDRFLVSEGIISAFPSSTVVCLDRHLSDHRPILLKEMYTDFGPSPFRTYHSWFKRDGFDIMVEQAWSSFSHSDSNSLIRFKKKLQDLKILIMFSLCPMCGLAPEDSYHVFFQCDMAKNILRRICRWWDLTWCDVSSFAD